MENKIIVRGTTADGEKRWEVVRFDGAYLPESNIFDLDDYESAFELRDRIEEKYREIKKIERNNLYMLGVYEDYIRTCNPLVRRVFSESIYLGESNGRYLSWSISHGEKNIEEMENQILAAINALCNTSFVFED